jgi:hypothetical protein
LLRLLAAVELREKQVALKAGDAERGLYEKGSRVRDGCACGNTRLGDHAADKGVVQVAGIMSAADKWCKEYTIDLGRSARDAQQPDQHERSEVKQVFAQAYSQFEAGLLAQGETKMCGAIYAQTRQSAQRAWVS